MGREEGTAGVSRETIEERMLEDVREAERVSARVEAATEAIGATGEVAALRDAIAEGPKLAERERGGEMETPADLLAAPMAEFLARWEDADCIECGHRYAKRKASTDPQVCAECTDRRVKGDKIEREVREVLDRFGDLRDRWLLSAGMTRRELTAERERIPGDLWARLIGDEMPGPLVREMIRGRTPQAGFGFTGEAGRGKTFALAWLVRTMVEARWRGWLPKHGAATVRKEWLAWCSWPQTVNRLRVQSLEDGGLADVAEIVSNLSTVEVLVLDDIGVERLRGGYEEDWVASQLDLIVDARHNEMRPTWYTTNLEPVEIVARYGTRMFSRLCGENLLVEVPTGPDLRVRP